MGHLQSSPLFPFEGKLLRNDILWRASRVQSCPSTRRPLGPQVKTPPGRPQGRSVKEARGKTRHFNFKHQRETKFATRGFLFTALLLPRTKARTLQPRVVQLWTARRSVRRRLGRASPGRRPRPLSTCCGSCPPPFRGRCRNSCRLWRNW
jgi:hypothetical protein